MFKDKIVLNKFNEWNYYTINDIGDINIFVGKNSEGLSTILDKISEKAGYEEIRYYYYRTNQCRYFYDFKKLIDGNNLFTEINLAKLLSLMRDNDGNVITIEKYELFLKGKHQYSTIDEYEERLVSIIAHLLSIKNCCFFIRNIDLGLHYTYFFDIWYIIFDICITNNIQFFTTSQSRSCVLEISDVMEYFPSCKIGIHRIGEKNRNKATTFNEREISIVRERNLEFR